MPLLDHFQPPFYSQMPFESFHGYWASAIVELLNRLTLPPEYVALPHVKLGTEIEVDVAAMESDAGAAEAHANGGVATAVYAPPQPALSVEVDFAGVDTFEVQVYKQEGGLKLVGAIELVSPANKDRPSHRQAFVRKCASLLQEKIGVVIVDIVTARPGNLHADLLEELAPAESVELNNEDALYAVAYRSQLKNHVEAWPEQLAIGQKLPTLPLWLSDVLAVPIDLEAAYLAACKALRVRVP